MSKYTVVASWDDAPPHLTPEVRAAYLAKIPEHMRDVRTKGMPKFGAGLVYPYDLEDIKIKPFAIPQTYLQGYSFDTGWKWNAAILGAYNVETDTIYITDIYKRGNAEPPINAAAIKRWGDWLAGVADAADTNRLDGRQYLQIYRELGLDIELPNKSQDAGIVMTANRLSNGGLRIFSHCAQLFDEYRIYFRDEKGKIKAEQDDHLMDCMRYLVMSGLKRFKLPPQKPTVQFGGIYMGGNDYGWMAN